MLHRISNFTRFAGLIALFTGVCHAQTTYYVSAISGSDTNSGTEAAPFKTIQQAADTMQEGDTCLIRQGVYRETVVPPTGDVTFRNYQDDYVVVTGLDVVEGWMSHTGDIYKAPIAERVTQVFVNGKHMNWARHPNQDGNRLSKRDMMTVQMVPVLKQSNNGTVILPDVEAKPDDYWKGGYVVGVSDDIPWWSSLRGEIESSSGNQLTCKNISFLWWQSANSFGKEFGTGYIIGAYNALDSATEWVWKDGELFYQPEAGAQMGDLIVEARTRTSAFDLTDKSGITIQGLRIKAANILLPDATDCVVVDCVVKYPGVFSTYFVPDYTTKQRAAWGDFENTGAGISVGGERNLIESCYVGYTWTTGIALYGNSNTAQNNIVEEANWMGERMSLISNIGDDNQILNNTLRRCGRDGIEMGHAEFNLKDTKTPIEGEELTGYAKRATVKYNDLRDVAYFSPDSGYLYVNHTAGYFDGRNPLAGSEIAYNFMEGYHSSIYYSGHGGIYLDNGSSGYTIHHNLIMNSIAGVKSNNLRLKHRPNHVFIYNNTFVNNNTPVRLNNQVTDNLDDVQVVAKNNLATHPNAQYLATETSNNTKVSAGSLVDVDGFDFQLKPNSPAVDAGIVIPDDSWPAGIDGVTGVTDDFIGSAPDAGAFEFGASPWTAGASIEMPVFVDELGFIDALIHGDPLVQSEIDAVVAAAEVAEAKAYAQRWQTTNEDKWLLTDFSALSQATADSLGNQGGMAYRQILDITPGLPYQASFEYRISNKDNKNGAGIRISIHEGELTGSNYSSLGSTEFTTNADVSNPEEGVGTIEFTPTSDRVYVVFHKIGHSAQTSKVRVARVEVGIAEQAPVFNAQSGGSQEAVFDRSGAVAESTSYVSTVNGVTMTITPESSFTSPATLGIQNAHLGVTGGKNDQTVNGGEKLLIRFDQPILLQTVDVGSIVADESVYLTSSDFDGLTGVTGVGDYDDGLNQFSQTGGDFLNLNDDSNYQGIFLTANNPIEMTVDADPDGSVSYNGITVKSLQIGTASVIESAPVGTSVATVTATDLNPNDTLSYAITAGNTGGAFSIDPQSGEITIDSALDYETQSRYILTLSVTDDSPRALSDIGTLTIGILDADESGGYSTYLSDHHSVAPNSGPLEHMDDDGVPNFVEYALGMRLDANDVEGLPTLTLAAANSDFEYSFKRARTTVRYVVQSTTTLENWTNAYTEWDSATNPANLVNVGEMQTVEMSMGEEDAKFYRLQVTE